MQVVASGSSLNEYSGSALVVTATASDRLGGTVAQLDETSQGYFTDLLSASELPTKVGKVSLFHQVPGLSTRCVAVVGAGPEEQFDAGTAYRCAGAAAKCLAGQTRPKIGFHFGAMDARLGAAAVAGAMNGGVGQDLFRAEKNLHPSDQIDWLGLDDHTIDRGKILGESVLLARHLVNLPANYLYPEAFAARTAELAISCGFELEVWDELRLRREGCGALLAVAAGSSKPPRLLIMRYAGKKQQPPLALVGKGVTFDSGGLSLKPSESMLAMKCDMAGAATVLAAMQAVARLQVDTPVVGLVGLVENMVSGSSYKLGDVLTSRSGKTVEIHNTDAEGRLVLADTLDVALEEQPAKIVDLATLTGACLVALGTDVAGLMSNNTVWEDQVRSAADRAGEAVWPLPMHAHFGEQIQSQVADIKNLGEGRWGGAITAAKFLEEFVGDTPWSHIDIAGPAFYDKPKPFCDAGGSGALVRTLVELAESL